MAATLLVGGLVAQTETGGRSCGITLKYTGTATACTKNAKLNIHQLGLPLHGGQPAILLFGASRFPKPYLFPVWACPWYVPPFHMIPCPKLPASGSVTWNSGAYPCSWVGLWVYHQLIVIRKDLTLASSNWGRAKVVRG